MIMLSLFTQSAKKNNQNWQIIYLLMLVAGVIFSALSASSRQVRVADVA
jgi:hypothetical protein